jgi:hypothetical protein
MWPVIGFLSSYFPCSDTSVKGSKWEIWC